MCVLCGALLTEAHWSERGGDEWPDEHNGTLTQEQAAARLMGSAPGTAVYKQLRPTSRLARRWLMPRRATLIVKRRDDVNQEHNRDRAYQTPRWLARAAP